MKKDYLYVAVLGWKPGLQVIDDVWFKLAGKPSEKVHCVSLLRKILSQVSHIQ